MVCAHWSPPYWGQTAAEQIRVLITTFFRAIEMSFHGTGKQFVCQTFIYSQLLMILAKLNSINTHQIIDYKVVTI